MRLIYQQGDERIAFPLDEGETFIGRKDDCEIYFPDSSLSKRHARFVRRGAELMLYDLDSKNGTLRNGEVVKETAVRLEEGDVVQCGKLEFKVEGLGGGEFDIVEDASHARGAKAISAAGSGGHAVARAVRSGEVHGSVLDEFPELPPSLEQPGADAPGPTARFRLVEGGEPRTWDLTGETITIGSKEENAIVVTGDGVSRYHAEVVFEGGKWLLKDLNARNGLFVAGKKIDIHELHDGDEVQVGTAKLRFETIKPGAWDEARKLLVKFKKDPVGTFKREPRVRIAAGCTIGALILLLLALPGGRGSGKRNDPQDLSWVIEGTVKLRSGNYREARDIFRKAQARVASNQQDLPRALTTLASLYCDTEDPMRFRWGKADELLGECARIERLPESTRSWVEEQLARVRVNKVAYDKLAEADQTGSSASSLAADKRFREAMKRFELTILRYSEVDPNSAFGQRAREQGTAVRRQVYLLVLSEVKALMQAPSPDWQGVVTFLAQGEAYTDTPEQRMELRRLKEDCETNQRDEEIYQRAVDIVSVRDVDNYPTAQRLLARIERRSRIYPDSQAYIQWIDADLKVRQAQKAYEGGDEARAFKLLNEALQHEVLGPEARASVRTRRQNWGRVVTAYNRGMELFNNNRTTEAQDEFTRVIQLEPSRANRYHTRALAQMRHIQQLQTLTLDLKLREGLDALRAGEHDRAYRFFGDVQKDPNKQPRDLQRIQEAVLDANRSRRLLHNAQKDFVHDRSERFLEIFYITKLLRRWLPAGQSGDRAEAEKLYQDVLKRLKVLEQVSGLDD